MNIENKVNELKLENLPILSSKNLFINFFARIYEFMIKLVNPRTAVFVVATLLVLNQVIDQWAWLILSGIFLGERWVKILKELLIEAKK